MSKHKRTALLEWFTTHDGTIHPALLLEHDEEFGLHFRAISDIPASIEQNGTPVCYCPMRLTLSYLNVKDALWLPNVNEKEKGCERRGTDSIVSPLIGRVEPRVVGYFFLCEQRLKGKESFWWAYIEALPKEKELSTPLWFDDEDLKWLLGTTMHSSQEPGKSAVEERRAMWQKEYASGIQILDEAGAVVDMFTWELYLWSATIFTSRAFASSIAAPNLEGEFSLLYPVVDIFNHKFGAKTVWDFRNGDFTLNITEGAQGGAQIFNNYAPKGNEELLMGYGFSLPHNPCDQLTLRLSQPPPEVHSALKQAFPHQFSSSDWSADSSMFYLRGSNHYSGGYEHELACLRGVPPELFHAVCAITSYTDADSSMDDEQLVDATFRAIVQRLRERRRQIVRWDGELTGGPKNRRQEFAKMYRDGQLEILNEIIKELESYFD